MSDSHTVEPQAAAALAALEGRDSPYARCPLCLQAVAHAEMVAAGRLDPEVRALVVANSVGWRPERGLCRSCAERFAEAHAELGTHPDFGRTGCRILPTPLRLGAARELTGRGVTIAFLDSGFYAHPDLVRPRNRILKYVDITRPNARAADLEKPDVSSWHGMMTSVVACGNGHLSAGLYRGLASQAHLVLVKVGSARRIVHDDIRRGLDWVIRNRRRYGIRIVNVSCGGDYEVSYLDDALSRAAERASREGLLLCGAAGNLGHHPGHPVLPPASAPSVLTVGGLDDQNRLATADWGMYHSSYGPTLDGLQKPEVIAPGIWVAAPILPGTPTADQAQLLAELAQAEDGKLRGLIESRRGSDADLDAAAGLEPYLIRQLVESKLRDNNVISGHYKHVDGTSFSSPIVASLAAQALEANPDLTARELRRIVIGTAARLPGVEVDRQGWGVIDAQAVVREAAQQGSKAGETSRGA